MKDLQDLLAKMENQKCWRAWDGRLPAIFLELGRKVIPSGECESWQGEYSICLMGCPWKIRRERQEIASDQSEKLEILQALSQFVGQRLEKITLNASLRDSITFSGELEIEVDRTGTYEWSIVTPQLEVEFGHNGVKFEEGEFAHRKVNFIE